MKKLEEKIKKQDKLKLYAMGLTVITILSLPVFAFSSHKSDMYVNIKANGEQNGSIEHPYKTINQALDKADKKTEIHVAKGEYNENITLKKGVKLFGEDKNDTIIKAKQDKWATVRMKGDSEIDGFTIKRGKQGIRVEEHAKSSIIDCIVKYNKKDGILIGGGNTKKSNGVYISKTEIRNNGKSGIYSMGSRRIVLMDSDIFDNKGDGVDLAAGTSAWIAGNSVKNNNGSGFKLTIGGSNIWTKKNSIKKNKREGIEISFFGRRGRINIDKSKIIGNQRYAIARVQRTSAPLSNNLWNKYLTFGSKNDFSRNVFGNISRIILIK